VQQPSLTEEDLRSFLVGSNLPSSSSLSPGPEPISAPPAPAAVPEPTPQHVAPIRPPGPMR